MRGRVREEKVRGERDSEGRERDGGREKRGR